MANAQATGASAHATGVAGAGRKTSMIVQTPEVRIAEYTFSPGDMNTWHHHSEVSDRFYCLEGLTTVDFREPARQIRLQPGESCEVPPGMVHRARNAGTAPCRYLLIQALGKFDYIQADQ